MIINQRKKKKRISFPAKNIKEEPFVANTVSSDKNEILIQTERYFLKFISMSAYLP
jgi:hypothetical protein